MRPAGYDSQSPSNLYLPAVAADFKLKGTKILDVQHS